MESCDSMVVKSWTRLSDFDFTCQELIPWSLFSQMIQQACQPLACLKCLVGVKQMICSCYFCSDCFEIGKSILPDSCVLNFLKTPYLSFVKLS